MRENNGYENMEQRQLPIVLFIMAFFLVAGLAIKEIDYKYFSIPQILADLYGWIWWRLMPGW